MSLKVTPRGKKIVKAIEGAVHGPAKLAPRTRKAVRNIVRDELKANELKFFDVALGATTISSTGGIVDVSLIPQSGTTQQTDTTRIGDNIMPTSFELRAYFSYNATSIFNVVRVIIFRWNVMDASHGIAPTVGAVLQYTGSVDSVMSPYAHDNRNQYSILYDKIMRLDNASQQGSLAIKIRKAAKKKMCFFGGTTEGQFKTYLLYISNRSADLPQIASGYFRTNFDDS